MTKENLDGSYDTADVFEPYPDFVLFHRPDRIHGRHASRRVDAGFEKLLPFNHEYIKTLVHYQDDFGTGNQIVVALIQKEGTIFNPEFSRP
ncbi:MAG: hypothetical protein IPH23_08870 [Gammaproteobacteria bacterium]|nr:hypothetical protein [Gammaproteobacteria bacterium]